MAFSRVIDSNYHSIRNWNKGDNLPDGKTLLKIHDKCGVSIDWLLTGKPAKGLKCPFCGDWPDNIRDAAADVKEILESDDEIVRTALQSNLAAFRQSIEKNKKGPPGSTNKPKSGMRARGKPSGWQSGADPAAKSVAG